MSEQKDFYSTLGVAKTASPEEIKKVYRKLAREYHPDRNKDKPGAEARFKEISEAYSVLSHKKKRAEYDQMRSNPFFGRAAGPGPGSGAGEPFTSGRDSQFYRMPDGTYVRVQSDGPGRATGSGSRQDMGGGGFSDLFSQFFGASAESGSIPRASGLDRKRTVRISFRRMIAGGKINMKIDGENLAIPIPRGVEDGYKVRIRGRGNQAPNGNRGDLYVTVRVGGVEKIHREGLDLHTEAQVSVFEAMLGTEGSVKLPLGKKIKLKIPAGVQAGEILRIKGKGIETDDGTGNLLVHIAIHIPRNLTARQKSILSEAARKTGLK